MRLLIMQSKASDLSLIHISLTFFLNLLIVFKYWFTKFSLYLILLRTSCLVIYLYLLRRDVYKRQEDTIWYLPFDSQRRAVRKRAAVPALPTSISASFFGGRIPKNEAEIDVGSAGTAARFLTALLGLSKGRYHIVCLLYTSRCV